MNLPNAYFMGKKSDEKIEEEDPDDDTMEETPEDVIMMLGFDPKEIKE